MTRFSQPNARMAHFDIYGKKRVGNVYFKVRK